jgi:hypothetical protein
MGLPDWCNQADFLEIKHKGVPVLCHPDVVSNQESSWSEEEQEEERGRQAHQAINDLFSSFDEDEEYEEEEFE